MNVIFIIIIVEMKNAKKFLKENITESKAVATKIFNVNARSLSAFIQRDLDAKNEKHNKMLQNHEINAFDDFIRSLLKHEILFISQIVFSAIVDLKRTHRLKTFSKRWFREWWKQDHFHKIKTKFLSIIRFEVDHEETIIDWFLKYKNILRILNIRKRRNIINFDENDFRSKCMKKQEIIVFIEIRKHYKSILKIANHWSSLKWSTQSKNFFFHSWSSFRDKI